MKVQLFQEKNPIIFTHIKIVTYSLSTYLHSFIQIRFLDFRENCRIVVARSSTEWQQESKQHKHMS